MMGFPISDASVSGVNTVCGLLIYLELCFDSASAPSGMVLTKNIIASR